MSIGPDNGSKWIESERGENRKIRTVLKIWSQY